MEAWDPTLAALQDRHEALAHAGRLRKHERGEARCPPGSLEPRGKRPVSWVGASSRHPRAVSRRPPRWLVRANQLTSALFFDRSGRNLS
jgi:hypothetical protein